MIKLNDLTKNILMEVMSLKRLKISIWKLMITNLWLLLENPAVVKLRY